MPFITCAGDEFAVVRSTDAGASFMAKTSAAHHGRLTLSLLYCEESTQLPLSTSDASLPNEVLYTASKTSWTVMGATQGGRAGVWVQDGTVTPMGRKAKTERNGAFDYVTDKTHLYLWLFADNAGTGDLQALANKY